MSDEKNESKINVEDLPRDAKELTDEEASEVKGGIGDANGDGSIDSRDFVITAQPTTGRKKQP
jgi:hypothetical protein